MAVPANVKLFMDFEASALFGGFPIEVGIARLDLRTGDIQFSGKLIRPHDRWTGMSWDPEAEAVHRISRDTLARDGEEAGEVATWVRTQIGNGPVHSDAPDFDGAWLSMLLEAAPSFRDAYTDAGIQILYSSGPVCLAPDLAAPFSQEEKRLRLREHRAADDAVRLALTYWFCFAN